MAKELLTPVAVQQLYSVLQRFDGSLLGAQLLLRGEVITNPADRRVLAAMIHALLRSDSQELERVALAYQKIAVHAQGKGGGSTTGTNQGSQRGLPKRSVENERSRTYLSLAGHSVGRPSHSRRRGTTQRPLLFGGQ
jgi:hypothetical protein